MFLAGIWGSILGSFQWSSKHIEELIPFLSFGMGIGILLSGSVSLSGRWKLVGLTLACMILVSPFWVLPRIFAGWNPVEDSAEIVTIEIVRMDAGGVGIIFSVPSGDSVYLYQEGSGIELQIRQRKLGIGYQMFSLPPLYFTIEAIGTYSFPEDAEGFPYAERLIRMLPYLEERNISIPLQGIQLFGRYTVRIDSMGEVTLVET
ncbi:MAG: hypothetical protein Kow009_02750 [Spirochaetales bacterium]